MSIKNFPNPAAFSAKTKDGGLPPHPFKVRVSYQVGVTRVNDRVLKKLARQHQGSWEGGGFDLKTERRDIIFAFRERRNAEAFQGRVRDMIYGRRR